MLHPRIASDPAVMFGKPVIRGTRITVEHVLRKIAGGMTDAEILGDHPHLTVEDVRSAVSFAADYLADETVVFAESA